MKNINTILFKKHSKEELLPDFKPEFPYIASYTDFDHYIGGQVPWHWHREVEIFFIKTGTLRYYTPEGMQSFPAGSGGFINSNILHMTRPACPGTIQQTHIFDPTIIGGMRGGLLEQKYVRPLITTPHAGIIHLTPSIPREAGIITAIHHAFDIPQDSYTYEMQLRTTLSEVWCGLLDIIANQTPANIATTAPNYSNTYEKIKIILEYIHQHYSEKLTTADLAAAAYISERECYRTFQRVLGTSPSTYIRDYRLREACFLLTGTGDTIADISQTVGLGSSSYFGKLFRDSLGCTPLKYRQKWQNPDTPGPNDDIHQFKKSL